jgi:hypothetical protein
MFEHSTESNRIESNRIKSNQIPCVYYIRPMIDYQNGISVFVTNTYIHTYIHTVDDVVFYSILLLLRFVFVFVLSNRFDSIRVDSIRVDSIACVTDYSLPPSSINSIHLPLLYVYHSLSSFWLRSPFFFASTCDSFIHSIVRSPNCTCAA